MTRRQRAAARLCAGSAALARRNGDRLAAWVSATGGRRDALLRCGCLGAGVTFTVLVLVTSPLVLGVAVSVWVVKAWRAREPVPVVAEPEVVFDQAEAEAAFLRFLADCIGDGNGVHLADALATLQAHGYHPGWSIGDLRAQCEALGVRVRDSLKVAGRVRVGVHSADLAAALPAPPPAHSEEGPVGGSSAGQGALPAEATSPATSGPDPFGGGADDLDEHVADALDIVR